MNKAIQILRTSNYIIAKLADKTLYVKCIHTGFINEIDDRFSKHSDALKELEHNDHHHEFIASVIGISSKARVFMTCLMSIVIGGLYLYSVPLIVSILTATMLLCFVVMLLCFITIPCILIKQCNYELKVN